MMMNRTCKHILVVAAWWVMYLQGQAQSRQQAMLDFPGKDAVMLQYSRELKLTMKDGAPVGETAHRQQMIILNENNAHLFSRYTVYHSSFNNLVSLEAFTQPAEGKGRLRVTETKTTGSSTDAIFYDDVKETNFHFPGLSVGAVTNVAYTLEHTNPFLMPKFMYSLGAPAYQVDFAVSFPEDIKVNYIVRNDPTGLLQFTTEKKRGITTYRWRMNRVQNPVYYADAPDESYYLPHVLIMITGYTSPNGEVKVLGSPADLYTWSSGFLKELNKKEDPALARLTDSLTRNATTPMQKATAIYQWVQHHIKYVAFEDALEGFRPRQATDVLGKRYGDCKDMCSILTAMMQHAGLEAYYAWIGTRNIPYRYEEVPTPATDNHMISVARINDTWHFVDGTAAYATLNLPPYQLQGKQAFAAVADTGYKLIEVPVAPPLTNQIIDSTFIYFTANGVAGNESVRYSGYFSQQLMGQLGLSTQKDGRDIVKTRMGKASNKFMLGDYTIDTAEAYHNQSRITAKFEIPDYGKKIGNDYYINLNLEKLLENQVIDTARRKIPKEHDFLYTVKQYHILDIPAGYTISYQPPNFEANNHLVQCSIRYTQAGSKLIAEQLVTLKTLMLQPNDFDTWNKVMLALKKHYSETVEVKKIM